MTDKKERLRYINIMEIKVAWSGTSPKKQETLSGLNDPSSRFFFENLFKLFCGK